MRPPHGFSFDVCPVFERDRIASLLSILIPVFFEMDTGE
jgi:hypothetical protein